MFLPGTAQQAPRPPQAAQTTQTPQVAQTNVPQKKVVPPAPAPALALKDEPVKKEDPRPIDELLDFIEGGANTQPKTADSKKAAKKARQKQKKVSVLQVLEFPCM